MTDHLYLFVDESGNCSRGSYYTVAACWCLSDQSNLHKVGQSTVGQLLTTVNQKLENFQASELKGSRLPTDILNHVVPCIEQFAYDDNTIKQARPPWETACPLRYSIKQLHTDLALEIIGNSFDSQLDCAQKLQSLSLISAINPLLHNQIVAHDTFTEVTIVLDSDTWKNPSEEVDELLSGIDLLDHPVNFELRDSTKVPGLQSVLHEQRNRLD